MRQLPSFLIVITVSSNACDGDGRDQPAKRGTPVQLDDPEGLVYSPSAHNDAARQYAAARSAAFTLLKARHETGTRDFDSVLRELSRIVCGEDLDFSDLDAIYPPARIAEASTVACGGFVLKDGTFLQKQPPAKPALPPGAPAPGTE
jgi:hypothetical protein